MTKKISTLKFILLSLCLSAVGIKANAQDFLWANRFGGEQADYGNSVAVDHLGNVYVIGNFVDSASFDPTGTAASLVGSLFKLVLPNGNPAGNSQNSIFLVKYDAQGKYVWARSFFGKQNASGADVAVDTAGNVYITGSFSDTADFNPGTTVNNLISKGIKDSRGINTPNAFLAKYTTDGDYMWAKNITSNDAVYSNSIAVDISGNAYVTGSFSGVAYFNSSSNVVTGANGASDVFLAKYDKDGNYIWVNNMGGTSGNTGYGVALSNSHVYLTGNFTGSISFDPKNSAITSSNGGIDAFLAKYDTAGKYKWAINIGGNGTDFGYSVAVDAAENAYVSGRFQQTIKFNPLDTTVRATSKALVNSYLAKYDSAGKYVWAKPILSTAVGYGLSTALDAAGNPYITGYFGGTVDFNPGGTPVEVIPTGNSAQLFVAKYSASGDYMWSRNTGSSGFTWGDAMTVDESGNAYVAGHYGTNLAVDFDPGPDSFKLTAKGGDGFVLKLACNDISSALLTISQCGESYTLNSIVYTASGTYTQKRPNVAGCDSIITLELSLFQLEPVINVNGFELGVAGTYATYQWIKNGNPIPGATNRTYMVTENANYQVLVTDSAGCEGTSEVYVVNNVSIDKVEGGNIQVFPNPVADRVYINSSVPVNAILYSVEGRMIQQLEKAKAVSVKDLASGIYMLHIIDKDARLLKVVKVIKQ